MTPSISRNVLVVVVVGRKTHIMPTLEICRALHSRGHSISFAAMDGQMDSLPSFISERHVVCQAMDPVGNVTMHREVGEAVAATRAGRKAIASSLWFIDSFYLEIYQNLRTIIEPDDSSSTPRYDFILADFLEIAAVDLALEFNIPYATVESQLSFPEGRASFIPGIPGLQQHILTSEHASLAQRVYEIWFAIVFLGGIIPWFRARQAMRKDCHGWRRIRPAAPDPVHLHLINCFWGLDVPRAHSPLLCMVGPLLTETWEALTDVLASFMSRRSSVVYVAFGTVASLSPARFCKLRAALAMLLQRGLIDGVIWSIKQVPDSSDYDEDENVVFLPWAPQRAVLAHASTKLFLTHAGTGSVNEGLYHGVPMLCIPIHGDQTAYALRCTAAGVALQLDKHNFTVEEVVQKAAALLEDWEGTVRLDCLRIQRITDIRANVGKHIAVSRIEEVMIDHEIRAQRPSTVQPRPPHLQIPADRMSFWRRHNIDLYTLGPILATFQGCAWVLKTLFAGRRKIMG